MSSKISEKFMVSNYHKARNLFGNLDKNIKMIEEELDVKLIARGSEINIEGLPEKVELARRTLEEMAKLLEEENTVSDRQLNYIIELLQDDNNLDFSSIFNEVIQVNHKGEEINPQTVGQKMYLEAMRKYDIVFSIGPAGTGKTYLAVVMAVKNLLNHRVDRIVLTRPAIEAGEELGFLPGDMQDKVDPYLRPLYDSLFDVLGPDKVREYLEKDIIEVAPLAYMRGRTLDDSFIILDEAQNTTTKQMKMMLTRIGFNSRAVITGDITQIDLPYNQKSGLGQVEEILKDIEGIEFVYLDETDVVRHNLVRKIITAYEEKENE
ncbi:phosphate starvation-inducible protein PhoH [Halarsenatibacter silvermanii]|uniref:PhoH-like protein n=2 Tax=Halarsenatibacter silvermanii TaxID=321763 RepID=A0A1G9JVC8_9FIRM|nr:phosphate starvation-inducible protein PhoH [Halarsenatibacter silvermanii]